MNIGVIGFGNMGQALVKGLISQGISKPNEIAVCAKSRETMNKAKSEYGVNVFSDINELAEWSDIIFFVIKGCVFDELKNIEKDIFKDKQVISFMAGVTIEKIREKIGDHPKIVRAMPDLAVAEGKGIIGYTMAEDNIVKIFKKLGFSFQVDEKDIEKIMAYSACGLGFAAYILNGFYTAGIKLGFDDAISNKIVKNIFVNAIEMSNYLETVSKVATKGGATEQGINHFKNKDINGIIYNAIELAYKRMI